jgi:hypothetical protein
VCNPRYPAGGDARLTAAHLIDLFQKQIQLSVAYIRQRASLQPSCVHLCEGATLQHQHHVERRIWGGGDARHGVAVSKRRKDDQGV